MRENLQINKGIILSGQNPPLKGKHDDKAIKVSIFEENMTAKLI